MCLTIGLRRVPEHDAAERGVLAARLARDFRKRRGVDVAGAGGGAGRGRADEDLDVLVERRFLRPGVPLVEVPRVGVVEVRERAEVVVELDVDRVEFRGVQYPTNESGRRGVQHTFTAEGSTHGSTYVDMYASGKVH